VSEQQPKKENQNVRTLIFMLILSVVCALILSFVASALSKPQDMARETDRSGQMLIASKILSHGGYFLLKNDKDEYVPAKYTPGGYLVEGATSDIASSSQILEVYNRRLIPMLVDNEGKLTTFEKSGVDKMEYLSEFQKTGYYKLPFKLLYKILPNVKEGEKIDIEKAKAEGWVFPVNGFGLWDAIYGYIAVAPNADTVIGITWYNQKETPGLGANIATAEWQSHFPGKLIFQESANGSTDFKTAPLGITVVKGKVSEVYGDSPKAKSAVDGMAGATLTGNGVIDAYRDSLGPYRPFLLKVHDEYVKEHPGNQEVKS